MVNGRGGMLSKFQIGLDVGRGGVYRKRLDFSKYSNRTRTLKYQIPITVVLADNYNNILFKQMWSRRIYGAIPGIYPEK